MCFLFLANARAQVITSGTLAGKVADPSHAVIPGATIQVVGSETGEMYHAQTNSAGNYVVGNLPSGTYVVTISAPGFRKASFQDVVIIVGQTYSLDAVLQVGKVTSTVTVTAGEQVLQTTQTSISTSLTTRAIKNLPGGSPGNNALNLAITSSAVETAGPPRQSTIDGLPQSAINITIDGINAQYPGKSSDGFFTMVNPQIPDVAQFTITTAAAGASQTGEGAAQVRFVTKRGTNQFHGGVWEYFRNDWLNSNYYFNNLAGLPRQTMRYNNYGYEIGGPILKNRLWFFNDLDIFQFPEGYSRTRTILTPQADQGLFTYTPTAMPSTTPSWVNCNADAGTCTANLMAMAGNYGGTSQVDPIVSKTLSEVQSATKAPGVRLLTPPSLYQQALSYNNVSSDTQIFPDLRLDWQATKDDSFSFVVHSSHLVLNPSFLNNRDYTYPVAPFNTNVGGYYATRSILVWGWRWNISPTQSNELRFGFQSSPASFFPNETLSVYPLMKTNLGSIHVQPVFPSSLLYNPYLPYSPSRNNAPVGQLTDNFVWAKGNHNIEMGFSLSRQYYRSANFSNQVATVDLGMVATDPMAAQFNTTNLPGISTANLSTAEQLYGMLAGRITRYSGKVAFSPATRQFVTGQFIDNHIHQSDLGIYATDSWRARSNLTINYGLRWQYEGVPVDDLNEYFTPVGGIAGAYGVSGTGNLFKPGTLTGATPTFVLNNGLPWYHNWYKGVAPSFGIAWEPHLHNSVWRVIFGRSGDSVFRGGYSISYVHNGLEAQIFSNNPGYEGSQLSFPISPSSTPVPGSYPAGSLQLQNLNIPSVVQTPSSFRQTFTITPSDFFSVNAYEPNLHMPYVQSWSMGIQRQISPSTVFEVRYVGNHAVGLWETVNLNEVNIFENGFLKEFGAAASNLNICQSEPGQCLQAQANAGVPSGAATTANFADWGLPGQSQLPIFTASFTGSTNTAPGAPTQMNSNFSSGSFLTDLQNGQAGSVAHTLSDLSYWTNLTTAGYPSNFWVVNPDATGGSYLMGSWGQSTYNGLVFDVRRRFGAGLMFDASYTFSKALTNFWSRGTFLNSTDSPVTLRNMSLMKGPSPFDIRNAFKFYDVWELPFGPGQSFSTHNSFINHLIGGWAFNSVLRWQSGIPTLLTGNLGLNGGTFNQYDSGVILNGLTAKQLQNQLGVYKTASPAPGAVWYWPQNLLGPNGSFVNSKYLQACNTAGKICQRLFVYGPPFFRADLGLQKTTAITERVNWVLGVNFLNAFNNANFYWPSPSNFGTVNRSLQTPNFGQITQAYQDLDGTGDPGGRVIQLVGEINF
jgi:hypothetical protein